MTSNVSGLVQEGVAALKAGRKQDAQKLLTRATQLDERNEEAWLWLSATVDSLENQQICLENVIAINPSNARALQGLEAIKRQLSRQQAAPSPRPASQSGTAASDPFTVSPVQADPLAAPPAAPQAHVPAFHGSGGNVALPSQSEYDAWVDGLGLGGAEAEVPQADLGGSDPFGFDSGPFQQPPAAVDPFAETIEAAPDAAPDYGDMVSPGQEADDVASSGSFDPFAIPQTSGYDSSYDDDSYDDSATYDDSTYETDNDPFGDINASAGDFSSASPFGDFESVDDFQDANDLVGFLEYIPEEIEATHLPGQAPVYPRGLLISLVAVSGGLGLSIIVMFILLLTR